MKNNCLKDDQEILLKTKKSPLYRYSLISIAVLNQSTASEDGIWVFT